MKKVILLLVLIFFGAFLYLLIYKGERHLSLLLLSLLFILLWNFVSFSVTRKMIEKEEGEKTFLFLPCSMIAGSDILQGALAIGEKEVSFYKRKNTKGDAERVLSKDISLLTGCYIGEISSVGMGMVLSFSDEDFKFRSRAAVRKKEEIERRLAK